jgi:hypothetical protein
MTDAVQQKFPNTEPYRPVRETMSPPAQKLDDHLTASIAELAPTPLPTVNLTEPKLMTTASPTGFVPGEISGLFKSLRARKDAMVTDLMATGAEVAATIATGEQMTAALKAEGDAMKAEFGLLTNNPPA